MSALLRRADTTPTEHAVGAPWAESVEVPAGSRLLFLSGQTPPVADGRAATDAPGSYGDMETQTRGVLRRLRDKLEAAGFGMPDLVKVTAFLVGEPRPGGAPDLGGFGRDWREAFGADDLPARTRVVVAGLMDPAWLVEIEAVAARKEDP